MCLWGEPEAPRKWVMVCTAYMRDDDPELGRGRSAAVLRIPKRPAAYGRGMICGHVGDFGEFKPSLWRRLLRCVDIMVAGGAGFCAHGFGGTGFCRCLG